MSIVVDGVRLALQLIVRFSHVLSPSPTVSDTYPIVRNPPVPSLIGLRYHGAPL
jgi:hypothetical protein